MKTLSDETKPEKCINSLTGSQRVEFAKQLAKRKGKSFDVIWSSSESRKKIRRARNTKT